MRFNIYGRFHLTIERVGDSWQTYRVAQGIKSPIDNLVIPADVAEGDLLIYLDDVYHEYAGFGQVIERIS